MVSSGGGGTPKAPNSPTPSGATVPYGETTSWNPSYTSVLNAGWATPESVDAGLAQGAVASNPVQPQNAVNPQIGIDAMRAEVAKMIAAGQAQQNMMQQKNAAAQAFQMSNFGNGGRAGRAGSSGYGGSARGGPGGNRGSSARGMGGGSRG